LDSLLDRGKTTVSGQPVLAVQRGPASRPGKAAPSANIARC